WERSQVAESKGEGSTRAYASYGWYYEVAELGFKCHMNDITETIRLGQVGTLPLYPDLSDEEVEYILASIRAFDEQHVRATSAAGRARARGVWDRHLSFSMESAQAWSKY